MDTNVPDSTAALTASNMTDNNDKRNNYDSRHHDDIGDDDNNNNKDISNNINNNDKGNTKEIYNDNNKEDSINTTTAAVSSSSSNNNNNNEDTSNNNNNNNTRLNNKIQCMSKESAQRINAGQAIYDLASCVKELIENSLDANSKSINIRLFNKGIDIIEVSDDGCGISKDSYEYIALPHATSKITKFDDIYNEKNCTTLGFRGEALHSIVNISEKVIISTRTKQDNLATKLEFNKDGTIIKPYTEMSRKIGTTIAIIKFYELLPVRRYDFIQQIKNQRQRLIQFVTGYALFSVGIRINLMDIKTTKKGEVYEKSILVTPYNTSSLHDTVSAILGSKSLSIMSDIVIDLSNVDNTEDDDNNHYNRNNKEETNENTSSQPSSIATTIPKWNVQGLISMAGDNNYISGVKYGEQYFAINNRPVDIPNLKRIINECYRAFHIGSDRKPNCVLNITLPGNAYDINLSPDKRQVQFTNEKYIFNTIRDNIVQLWGKQTNGQFQHNNIELSTNNTDDALVVGDDDDDDNNNEHNNNNNDQEIGDCSISSTSRLFHRRYGFVHDPITAVVKEHDEVQKRIEYEISSPDRCRKKLIVRRKSSTQYEYKHPDDDDDDDNDDNNKPAATSDNTTNAIPAPPDVIDRISSTRQRKRSLDDIIISSSNNNPPNITTTQSFESPPLEQQQKHIRLLQQQDNNNNPAIVSASSTTTVQNISTVTDTDNNYNTSSRIDHMSSRVHDNDKKKVKLEENQKQPLSRFAAFSATSSSSSSVNSASLLRKNTTTSSSKVSWSEQQQWRNIQTKFNDLGNNSENDILNTMKDEDYDTNTKLDIEKSASSTNNKNNNNNSQKRRVSFGLERFGFGSVTKVAKRSSDESTNSTGKNDEMELDEVKEGPTFTTKSNAKSNETVQTTTQNRKRDSTSNHRNTDITSDENVSPSMTTTSTTTTTTEIESTESTVWSTFKGTNDVVLAALNDRIAMRERKHTFRASYADYKTDPTLLESVSLEKSSSSSSNSNTNSTSSQQQQTPTSVSLTKDDFRGMTVIGQFNMGFILAKSRDGNLWILDQHACDEKYNFENLCRDTVIHEQKLIVPLPLELSPAEELCVLDHMDIFEKNGFRFSYDDSKEPRHRLALTALPHSGARDGRKAVQYGKEDVVALCSILNSTMDDDDDDAAASNVINNGGTGTDGTGLYGNNAVRRYATGNRSGETANGAIIARLPKTIAMFASRACRGSVMIGKGLSRKEMDKIVKRLADIEHPWNCPHGRPTMRHVGDLGKIVLRDEQRAAEYAAGPSTTSLSQEEDEEIL